MPRDVDMYLGFLRWFDKAGGEKFMTLNAYISEEEGPAGGVVVKGPTWLTAQF